MNDIKTWEERHKPGVNFTWTPTPITDAMCEEIAELRAALAARATPVQPVPQYRPKRPAGSPWHDVPKGEYPCVPADLYEVRTLYRAAPPQQVDTGELPG